MMPRTPHTILRAASLSVALVGLHALVQAQPAQPTQPATPATPSAPFSTTPSTPSPAQPWPYEARPAAQDLPAGAMPLPATDDTPRPLVWRVFAGAERDTNVLRASQAQSDRIGLFGAGVRLDKSYSLQRLVLDADLTARRFDRHDALDHELLNFRAAWDFAVTPRLRGTVSTQQEQVRDLTDAGAGLMRVDRRTERRHLLEARLEPGGGWLSEAGVEHARVRSDERRAIDADVDIDSLRVAGGYEFPSGLRLLGQLRRGTGDYRDTSAGDFKETGLDLLLRAARRSALSLDARLGHLRRRHDADGLRDFDGPVGEANLVWQAASKTRLELHAARELGHYGADGGGRVKAWRLALAPVWEAGAHTTVTLRHAHERQDWEVAPTAPDAGREDRLRSTSLSLQWRPRAWLGLDAQVRALRRDSSLTANRFRATVTSLVARLNF